MDIEEEVYEQMEFDLMGELPVIPVWEQTVAKMIVDKEEQPRVFRKPKFQEEFEEGFV